MYQVEGLNLGYDSLSSTAGGGGASSSTFKYFMKSHTHMQVRYTARELIQTQR